MATESNLITWSNDNADTETNDSIRRKSRAEIMRDYDVRTIDRRTYLKELRAERRNKPPTHKTLLGPTHRGKTTLELQELHEEISPEKQAILLSAKPPHRDPVMNKAAEQLNLTIIDHWPPSMYETRRAKWKNKNGWVVRPEQTLSDLDRDHHNVRQHFRAAMLDAYSTKDPLIIVHDEAHKIYNVYGLKKEYEAPLMSGLPDNASHSLIQRGRYMPYLAYDAPENLVIFNDPDLSNQKRYAEIGGVDPYVVISITKGLKTYETDQGFTISEFLHIRRAGPRLTVVDIT